MRGKPFEKGHKLSLGELNGRWKGDNVTKKSALHTWVRRRKIKPKLCEDCKEFPPYDLANISGKYKRDTNDFKYVCRRCHMKNDGRLKKLSKYNFKKGYTSWNKTKEKLGEEK